MKNHMPIIAAPLMIMTALAAETERTRKSFSGISGARERASTSRKPRISRTATARATRVPGASQPWASVSAMP